MKRTKKQAAKSYADRQPLGFEAKPVIKISRKYSLSRTVFKVKANAEGVI